MDHHTVNHGAGEYVVDRAHSNGMESFWSVLSRGYHGIFHKISHWHPNPYVNEFCSRSNIRGLDTVEMMLSMVAGMVGKQLTYMELIGM